MRKHNPHSSSSSYSPKSRKPRKRNDQTLKRILMFFGLVIWVIFFVVVTYFFFEIELNLLSSTAVIKSILSGNASDIADFSEYLPPPEQAMDEGEEIARPPLEVGSSILNAVPKRKPKQKVDGSKYLERKLVPTLTKPEILESPYEIVEPEAKEIIPEPIIQLQHDEEKPIPEEEKTQHQEPPTENIFPEVEDSKNQDASNDLQIHSPEVLTTRGLGESGIAVNVDDLNEDEKQELGQGKEDFGYNEVISKKISVHRTIPDGRNSECTKKDYSKLHLKASVIISVYNEGWSVLLRTIHSILDRSPDRLLKEVIIVDDFSDSKFGYMQHHLSTYLSAFPKVKLFRTEHRLGVVKARLFGVEKSEADVIIFLDSHVEVNKEWLEPLIAQIEQNNQNVAIPVLDQISPETFQYTPSPTAPFSEIFMWDLNMFRNTPKNVNQLKEESPLHTPVSSSGQFAISKSYFELLGKYDPSLEHYGAENLELSLKVWRCGGHLNLVPCSRVGHVERPRMPYLHSLEEQIDRNFLRVAQVWMDEHAVYYQHSKKSLSSLNPGDITDRILLKKTLNCSSFEWYLQHIHTSLYNPKKSSIADGQIRSLGMDGTLCVDSASQAGSTAILFPCHGMGGNQRWWLTEKGEIRRYDQCMDYWGEKIALYPCHGQKGNQKWIYKHDVRNAIL
ncbi:unnamed protein product [Orchesella dallaii]|uniref:Polypeptide N-acetylgalactosaminyltransferase n=1 Tax=Orchesella dallaii TaxID=48710 RepID=A0ABP1PRL4_9HEXA